MVFGEFKDKRNAKLGMAEYNGIDWARHVLTKLVIVLCLTRLYQEFNSNTVCRHCTPIFFFVIRFLRYQYLLIKSREYCQA